MNRTKYLCDGGADETIINEAAFLKICRDEPKTRIQPYNGPPFHSCTGEMQIRGQLKLDHCIIDPNDPQATEGVTIIVADHSAKHECILGRDLTYKIPILKEQMEKTRDSIQKMSEIIQNKEPVIFDKSPPDLMFDSKQEARNDEKSESEVERY